MSKEKKPETEVAIKQDNAPVAVSAEAAAGNWGVIEDLETTDLLVPKIYHQQGLSKFVSDGKAKAGDFCDSLTGEVLGKREDPLEVIVFGSYKSMVVKKYDLMSNSFKLHEVITITPENAKAMAEMPPTEETDEGKFQRSLQYNLYCLLPSRITELPFVLSLGSTKTKAARKINTMIFKLSQLKRPGASVVFELSSVQEKNEKGSWYGLEVNQGRDSTPEELMRAYAWHQKSKSQKFVVVEEEAAVDAAVAASQSGDVDQDVTY
jgi:hypothetical protein